MKTENNNIIFTILNKKLIYILSTIWLVSLIATILFFTIVPPEYVVLCLPFVFFLFVLPIFMIGMRNKIIYRFTIYELQFRGENPINIKWPDIISYNIKDKFITLTLKDNQEKTLPLLQFKADEIEKVIALYLNKAKNITG